MQKLKKVSEITAPRSITDMSGAAATKARREFLANAKAEKEAAGFVCKIVGKGSYETVVVYQPTEVADRDQLRGTCQACGGSVAIVNGLTSHHGYERPGYGYMVGGCVGVRELAAEKDLTIATRRHDAALVFAGNCESEAAKIEAFDATGAEREEVTKARVALEAAKAAEYPSFYAKRNAVDAAIRTLNEAKDKARHLRGDAKSARQYASFIVETIYPKLGQDYRTVKITA